MSIIRAPKVESFFYVLDKKISEDKRLSWQARGLLVYLLGKPDHWKVSIEALKAETIDSRKPTSRDGIYSMLDELSSAGYINRVQVRDESGRMACFDYIVNETPFPDKPFPDAPVAADKTLVSNDLKQELKKANSCHQQAEDIPFEKILKTYNDQCGELLSKAVKLDKKRKKNIERCWIEEYQGARLFSSGAFWKLYFDKCLTNPHWLGETGSWKADLEFLTRETTVTRVFEMIGAEELRKISEQLKKSAIKKAEVTV